MKKYISSIKLTETLTLTECKDGFWLYDDTRGMNLSMRAKTPQDAYIECISYYQKRLMEMEHKYKTLSSTVESFVSTLEESNND